MTAFDPVAPVGCGRGAPMGRAGNPHPEGGKRVYLRRVRLDSGGYDRGGAYWGHGEPLYVAFQEGGEFCAYFRARGRAAARRTLDEEYMRETE